MAAALSKGIRGLYLQRFMPTMLYALCVHAFRSGMVELHCECGASGGLIAAGGFTAASAAGFDAPRCQGIVACAPSVKVEQHGGAFACWPP